LGAIVELLDGLEDPLARSAAPAAHCYDSPIRSWTSLRKIGDLLDGSPMRGMGGRRAANLAVQSTGACLAPGYLIGFVFFSTTADTALRALQPRRNNQLNHPKSSPRTRRMTLRANGTSTLERFRTSRGPRRHGKEGSPTCPDSRGPRKKKSLGTSSIAPRPVHHRGSVNLIPTENRPCGRAIDPVIMQHR